MDPSSPFYVSEHGMPPAGVSVVDVMGLEILDRDLFRAGVVYDEHLPLYGGQVAAQALIAAAKTVPEGRFAHSAQGYFLRPGDSSKPIVLQVERDRDGGTFSARRVIAIQDGEVILNLGASFQQTRVGEDLTYGEPPASPDPETLEASDAPRLISFEHRLPPQPDEYMVMPRRAWVRCTADLPDDPHLHAALLMYMSDLWTGFGSEPSVANKALSTLSHALWFHQPVRLDSWVLMDLAPEKIGGGRGLYTGRLWDREGHHVGSLIQESLYVPMRRRR
jgi:acyl-CoA thioesterase-2